MSKPPAFEIVRESHCGLCERNYCRCHHHRVVKPYARAQRVGVIGGVGRCAMPPLLFWPGPPARIIGGKREKAERERERDVLSSFLRREM